jgi:3-hydroxybutyryl-CoA dehydrogenase
MKFEDIKNVAVIGSGLMGHGIAQEFAMKGYKVRMNDISEDHLTKALEDIRRNLSMMRQAGLVSEKDTVKTIENISTSTSLEAVASDADLVIEAVYENLELKQRIFKELDVNCPKHSILASNSSSLMPSFMAKSTQRPEKVLITHYFNPPYLLPLVELVRSEFTSDDTVQCMFDLYTSMGKTPAVVQKEVPGFIGNRLQVALIREALSLVENGVASPRDIDVVVKNSFGRRLSAAGPFEIFDVAGWDLTLAVSKYLMPHIESSKEVPKILEEKVRAGELGVKSGKGFYEYSDESADVLRNRIAQALIKIASWEK